MSQESRESAPEASDLAEDRTIISPFDALHHGFEVIGPGLDAQIAWFNNALLNGAEVEALVALSVVWTQVWGGGFRCYDTGANRSPPRGKGGSRARRRQESSVRSEDGPTQPCQPP